MNFNICAICIKPIAYIYVYIYWRNRQNVVIIILRVLISTSVSIVFKVLKYRCISCLTFSPIFFIFTSLSSTCCALNPSALFTRTPGLCHPLCVDVYYTAPQNLLRTWMGKSYVITLERYLGGHSKTGWTLGKPSRGRSCLRVNVSQPDYSLRITGYISLETPWLSCHGRSLYRGP